MYEYNNNMNNFNDQSSMNNNRTAAPKKKKSGMSFFGKLVTAAAVGLTFGVVGAGGYYGTTRVIDYFMPKKQVSEASLTKSESTAEEKIGKNIEKSIEAIKTSASLPKEVEEVNITSIDVTDIAENGLPSVVSITNKSVQEIMSMWGMGIQQYESTSAGSGIIIGENDDELLIVSNNHVVDSADTLSVGFDDDEVYSAYVKGTDPEQDLAVIAVKLSDIKESTKKDIKIAVIGDSDSLKVGEQVVAIGNALGYGQSVTTGIVSALNRDVTKDNVDNPLIQTDAAINPGNSGGALFNMKGELIGINSAKLAATQVEGIGYAIPLKSAQPIIEQLMNREHRDQVDEEEAGYLGISGVSVDTKTSRTYGIPEGVYIQTVEEDSPAQQAGLVKSDVIKKFDGITVSSISDIRKQLDYYKAGETVDLLIYRLEDAEYVEETVSITLGSREGTPLDPKNNKEVNNAKDSDDKAADSHKDGSADSDSRGNNDNPNVREFRLDEDTINSIFELFGR